MAKQTFSVGQVLTAAQMTSLQQTAMGGGAASAKTSSYVLVAADAGTTISMTSTSATTITVNTGLFAAGDTVFIQNLGSGTCTITAGTATVNTAGSLILPQYDAGILYFVSASSAIFYDYIQVGATSPLTTKGDIYVYGTSDTRLPVGTNGHTLVADSAQATGLKWQAASSGALTLIDEVSFTASSTINVNDVFSSTYTNYRILISCASSTGSNSTLTMRLRVSGSDTNTNYSTISIYGENGGAGSDTNGPGTDEFGLYQVGSSTYKSGLGTIDITNPNVATLTGITGFGSGITSNTASTQLRIFHGQQTDSTQFTGFTILSGQTLTGIISIYGYQKE